MVILSFFYFFYSYYLPYINSKRINRAATHFTITSSFSFVVLILERVETAIIHIKY
jgi:hypothetical protein